MVQKDNKNAAQALTNETDYSEHEPIEEDEEQEVQESKPAAKQKRHYTTPNILTDVDFNSPSPSFKEFYTSLGSPTADRNKYLLISVWFKDQGVKEISADHVYTAFKFMNWPVPKDVGQPFRNLKSIGQVNSGSAAGTFSINHIGEEALRRATEKS